MRWPAVETVPLTISAQGFADTTSSIALSDMAFSLNGPFGSQSPIRVVLERGPQTARISAAAVAPLNLPRDFGSSSPATIRPGAADIPITISSSNSDVLGVDTPQVLFKAGSSSADVVFRPLATGPASLLLSAPPGYVNDPKQSQLDFNVVGAALNAPQAITLGRDLQTSLGVNPEVAFSGPTILTVVSSDPSSVLVSDSATSPGRAQITLTAQPNQQLPSYYIQSLKDNGSATVTISADGYQSSSTTVTMVPAAAVFANSTDTLDVFTGALQHLEVELSPLDPNTLKPSQFNFQPPRPGANIQVSITSSDNRILSPLVSSIQMPVQGPTFVDVRPLAVGTAILSLSTLPGEPAAASGRQIVFNVQTPHVSIPSFTRPGI
jgi:hypothetical protein